MQLDEAGGKADEWTGERVDQTPREPQHASVAALSQNWKKLPFWRLNAVMWLVFAVLFFVRVSLHLDLFPAIALSLFQLTLCLLLTGILQITYSRLQTRFTFGIETAGWIIGLSLVATLVQSVAAHGLISLTGWKNPNWSLMELWLMRMMFFWLVYMVWSLFFFWVRAEKISVENVQRARDAEADAERMELQLLRSQLDPHFLFNALNGIATVVQAESPSASSMVRELADYLRYSLDHRHDAAVPLAREIEAMMSYLRIEQARFEEELHVEITTDEASRRREIPCFLLLPLVENAVKHSFHASEPPRHVSINAESRNDTLAIEILNTGTLSNGTPEKAGVGLDVLRRRLELHYPGRHRFSLSAENGVVRAAMELEGDPCSA